MRNAIGILIVLAALQAALVGGAAGATVTLKPATAALNPAQEQPFTAVVANGPAKFTLRWFVNGVRGGTTPAGLIGASGDYHAPAIQPVSGKSTVGVEVWSVATATAPAAKVASTTAMVTIRNTARIAITPSARTVPLGGRYDFNTTITGAPGNMRVKWYVNGDPDGSPTLGTIDAAGLYRAPSTIQPLMRFPLRADLLPPGADTRVLATHTAMIQLKNTSNVTLSPAAVTLAPGGIQRFSAYVEGAPPGYRLRWSVNSAIGGNAATGTVSTAGAYTAPAAIPTEKPVVKVEVLAPGTAITVLDSDTAPILVKYPPLVLTTVAPLVVKPGPYTLALRGSGFRKTTTATLNNVAAAVTFVSASEVRVSSTATDADLGSRVTVRVANPAPDATAAFSFFYVRSTTAPLLSNLEAHRFLRQATWGPTPADLDKVMRIGKQAWLQEQFNQSVSQIPSSLLNKPLEYTQEHFLRLALTADDQLRLRMAFALHKIWVVSGLEVDGAEQYIPYLRVLIQNAFGNFSNVMREVTLTAAMGDYLDMANNVKANPQTGAMANENFGREIMQLFTLGLFRLNPDGTQQLDPQGQPTPTYTQSEVLEFARVFTGWTYSDGKPGAPTQLQWHDHGGPMEAVQKYHDTGAKTLLNGTVLPANQPAETDLDQALQNIFQHPNVGPFIGKQLIQQFVTSNPSDAYVQRVAAAFGNNGLGVRGDLRAVLTAILTDPEASLSAPNAGKLMEPALFVTHVVRGLRATVTDTPFLAEFATDMGQKVFYPPSVFSYFSPGYRIGGGTQLAPEFQIYTTATAMARVNFLARLLGGSFSGSVSIPWATLSPLARNPDSFVDYINEIFMGSRMSAEMRTLILQSMLSASGDKEKAQTALYLTLMSPQYQIQR